MLQVRKKKAFKLLLALMLLAFVMLVSVISASADDLVWNLLTDKDAGYKVQKNGHFVETVDEDGNILVHNTDTNKQGSYYIYDENNILGSYRTFSLEGDFYFEAFPSGIRKDGDVESTPREKPLSFLCWSYKTIDGKTQYFNALRLDDEGYLHLPDGFNTKKSNVQLETGRWYNIRIVFTPQNAACELFVDGEKEADFLIIRFDTNKYVSNFVRFFDGFFSWGVRLKNILVKTDSDYIVGLREEETADYVGYQTAKPVDDTFTLRTILGLNLTDYNRVGYEVIQLYKDDDGQLFAEPLSLKSKVIYETIRDAAGNTYNIKELYGYNYAAALEIPNIPAEPYFDFLEIVVRPYVLTMDGMRLYGTSTILVHTGDVDAEGYPLLTEKKDSVIKISPTDDTFIYAGAAFGSTSFGDNAILQFKNLDSKNISPERASYFKFTLSPEQAKIIESAVSARLCVNVRNDVPYDLVVHGTSTDWDEATLTYNNHAQVAKTEEEILRGPSRGGQYFYVDILTYLQEAMLNEDGSLTVSFRFTNAGAEDAPLGYFFSKEGDEDTRPFLEIVTTIYEPQLNFGKISNNGYEPWGYAEMLVDEWFDVTVDEVFKRDENGNLIDYEVKDSASLGYQDTEAKGDFTLEMPWLNGFVWSNTGGVKTEWETKRFARTLSTLGTSVANDYLSSEYATTKTEYDVYGGIANAGFTGQATGFFHTEIIGGRTYIIDPIGNPYFAIGMDDVTMTNKEFALEKYGSEEAFFEESTRLLQEMGINTAHVSAKKQVLAVENGLNVVVDLGAIPQYMKTVGAGGIGEGAYPNNNTMNFFDPDFIKWVNKNLPAAILEGGYADNPRVLGYTTDNEIPSGDDMLYRYLTTDPSEPSAAFSYAVAWTWLARRMETFAPSLTEYMNSPEMEQMNSEFLAFAFSTYYRACREAIESVDPNHMYLGSRANLTCVTNEMFLRMAGNYLDAVTLNIYGGLHYPWDTMVNVYRYSGKPFLVSEFFAKGLDAIDDHGFMMASSTGAGFLVKTQQERADFYEHHALACLESNACVGWTWYRMIDNDQPLYRSVNLGKEVVMAYVDFGNQKGLSFLDKENNLYTAEQVGAVDLMDEGDLMMSNLNVNKGVINRNYTSTVAVYTYDKNGKMIDIHSYWVETPDSYEPAEGTILFGLDGSGIFTVGRKNNADGSYTETVLTTYDGVYVALASAMRKVSDNLIGLVKFFDAQ